MPLLEINLENITPPPPTMNGGSGGGMLIVFVIRSYPIRGHCLNNFVTADLRVLAHIVLFAQIGELARRLAIACTKTGNT